MLRLESAVSLPIPVFYRETSSYSHPAHLERFSILIGCFGKIRHFGKTIKNKQVCLITLQVYELVCNKQDMLVFL